MAESAEQQGERCPKCRSIEKDACNRACRTHRHIWHSDVEGTMSKVEQGEPQHRDTKEIVKFARELGVNLADSDWHIFEQFVDAAVRHAAASLPESQPSPEMDYSEEVDSLLRSDAFAGPLCWDREQLIVWLRAHDARVQPSSVAGTESSLVREAYIILEGLRLGVTWEIAPPIMDEIVKWCAMAESALKESSRGK